MHTVTFNKQHTLPRTISSKLMDYSVTFLETARETGGSYCKVEVLMQPGSNNGPHYHTSFTETFEVTEGLLGVQLGDGTVYLRPGESVTAPVNIKHRFFNASQTAVTRFNCTVAPARQFEQLLRIAYGLANDGKTNAKGVPGIWHIALMFSMGDTYLPGMPLWLQQVLLGGIAQLARLLAKDNGLEKYYKV